MIIDKTIKLKITSGNVNHYKKFYNCKVGDTIDVNIEHLTKYCSVLVHVKCDICDKEKIVPYKRYTWNTSNKGFYVCSLSCAQEKIKITKIENHGDPNFCNLEQRKKTCEERYGDENYKNAEKIKKTNLEKYGTENPSNNQDVKNKRIETNNKLYGADHPMKNNEIVLKKKKTNLERYGDENYTNPEKRMKTKEIRYGDPYYFNVEKGKETKLKKGLIVPNEKLTEWEIYKKLVKNITNKYKKELFENWDGHDYYDNEYIKGNLNLKPIDRFYPTIDHKTSIHYGFINNIPPETIGDISNLCITKKYINSSKRNKIIYS